MESILMYFESIPSTHRSAILVGGITFFWLLEGATPLFNMQYRKWPHALTNFFFTLTTILVNMPLAFLLLFMADYTAANNFGLLNWLPNVPLWLYALLGVALLDLVGAYTAHLVQHKVKLLWLVHAVHHTDAYVDTTTANRHHPLESLIRYVFTLIGVLLVGAPIGVVMLYQSLSVVLSQFNHANIKLPLKIDKLISLILVSPNMHKVHHHYKLPYTDSNYGNIFAIWDRLFGTFMYLKPEQIVYGVDTYTNVDENAKIKSLLKQPFGPYRAPTTKG